ncbi:MAG: hypothetical protein GC187_11920 [Alphaproteobacteria bacterium]|nr:hypothetical protein [Alphaproteobacteria bacterium]
MSEEPSEATRTLKSKEFFGWPIGEILYCIAAALFLFGVFSAFNNHERTSRYSWDAWSFETWSILILFMVGALSIVCIGYVINTLNKILWSASSAEDRTRFFD